MSHESLVLLPLWYVVFLLSVTCHEAAHAAAAWRGGDQTAYLGGQVSLNPIPHIRRELFGTVIVPLGSYLMYGMSGSGFRWMIGWASAPYDPYWEERHPKRAAIMAASGPLANLVLATIAFAALKAGIAADLWSPFSYELDHLVTTGVDQGTLIEGLGRFCSVMLSLNVILFLFNLLPLPPMDGAAVLYGLVPSTRRMRDMMRASPMMGLLGILLAWRIFPYLFRPVYYDMILGWLFG